MFPMILSAALSGLGAYTTASVGKATAQANTRVSAAQADAANRTATAGNRFAASKGAFQRYMQADNNAETLDAGGQRLEANLINARRQDDEGIQASFEDQIRNAEQLGAQAAASAFAGVSGGAADIVSVSTRLMQQRSEQQAKTNRGFRLYDVSRRAAAIEAQTVRSLDSSLILDSLDYTVQVAKYNPYTSPAAAGIFSMLGSAVSNSSNLKFGSKNEWGTGSTFGNQDYGLFL